ncbi:MAG: 23S rRNA (adenine(2503)-C(2))-methyltransferase RlmN, partial [Pseudomonadota bacterium]
MRDARPADEAVLPQVVGYEPAHDGRPTLIGLDRDGLADAVRSVGVPERQIRMRVGQLWQWLYQRGV